MDISTAMDNLRMAAAGLIQAAPEELLARIADLKAVCFDNPARQTELNRLEIEVITKASNPSAPSLATYDSVYGTINPSDLRPSSRDSDMNHRAYKCAKIFLTRIANNTDVMDPEELTQILMDGISEPATPSDQEGWAILFDPYRDGCPQASPSSTSFPRAITQALINHSTETDGPVYALFTNGLQNYALYYSKKGVNYLLYDYSESCVFKFRGPEPLHSFLDENSLFSLGGEAPIKVKFFEFTDVSLPTGRLERTLHQALAHLETLLSASPTDPLLLSQKRDVLGNLNILLKTSASVPSSVPQAAGGAGLPPPPTPKERLEELVQTGVSSYDQKLHLAFDAVNRKHSIGLKEYLFNRPGGYNEAAARLGLPQVNTANYTYPINLHLSLFMGHYQEAIAHFKTDLDKYE